MAGTVKATTLTEGKDLPLKTFDSAMQPSNLDLEGERGWGHG